MVSPSSLSIPTNYSGFHFRWLCLKKMNGRSKRLSDETSSEPSMVLVKDGPWVGGVGMGSRNDGSFFLSFFVFSRRLEMPEDLCKRLYDLKLSV